MRNRWQRLAARDGSRARAAALSAPSAASDRRRIALIAREPCVFDGALLFDGKEVGKFDLGSWSHHPAFLAELTVLIGRLRIPPERVPNPPDFIPAPTATEPDGICYGRRVDWI